MKYELTRYEVTQVVEMSVTHIIFAEHADEANDIASERTHAVCKVLRRRNKKLSFGDITDDYIPARDEPSHDR